MKKEKAKKKAPRDWGPTKQKKKRGIIAEEFSGRNMTGFGGAELIRRALEAFRISERFEEIGKGIKKRMRGYRVVELFESVIYGIMLGYGRPWHMRELRWDRVFLRIIGWERFPSQSTLSRFFGRMKVGVADKIEQMNRELVWLWRGKKLKDVTLDLDSHVITVYGEQQRASVGYNPKKRGRKSYHPLMAFIGETGDFIAGRLRTGKAKELKGIKTFFRRVLRGLPRGCRVKRVRADSGFYSFAFIKFLASKGIFFIIRARRYPHYMWHALFMRRWKHYKGGISIGEFSLRVGKRSYRMVVMRRQIVSDKTLCEMMAKNVMMARRECYEYHFLVTNHPKDVSGYEIWRMYCKRANCENFIKEAVYSFSLDNIISHHYAGNAVYFQLVMLCYNLANWMKDRVKNHLEKRRMWRSFYRMLLWIPARLVTSARKTRLILPQDHPGRDMFLDLRACLDSV